MKAFRWKLSDEDCPMSADQNGAAASRLVETTLTIVNKKGLHARASARFAETASAFAAEIWVSRDSMTVNAASIMGLLMLAASQGSEIALSAQGADAEAAVEALRTLVADKFGEPG